MIEVASLLGVSYSGKSTLAESLVPRLAEVGIGADIIKKDTAVHAIGADYYGLGADASGYSIRGFMRRGQIPPSELHAWMNARVKESIALGNIAILEGGTRTRSAQAETLAGLELDNDGLAIFMLQLPFTEVLHRAKQRRKDSERYDDILPIALAKLQSQYRGTWSSNAPRISDPDVFPLNAELSPSILSEQVVERILASRQ
jgi:adenylate kinase family enzyme